MAKKRGSSDSTTSTEQPTRLPAVPPVKPDKCKVGEADWNLFKSSSSSSRNCNSNGSSNNSLDAVPLDQSNGCKQNPEKSPSNCSSGTADMSDEFGHDESGGVVVTPDNVNYRNNSDSSAGCPGLASGNNIICNSSTPTGISSSNENLAHFDSPKTSKQATEKPAKEQSKRDKHRSKSCGYVPKKKVQKEQIDEDKLFVTLALNSEAEKIIEKKKSKKAAVKKRVQDEEELQTAHGGKKGTTSGKTGRHHRRALSIGGLMPTDKEHMDEDKSVVTLPLSGLENIVQIKSRKAGTSDDQLDKFIERKSKKAAKLALDNELESGIDKKSKKAAELALSNELEKVIEKKSKKANTMALNNELENMNETKSKKSSKKKKVQQEEEVESGGSEEKGTTTRKTGRRESTASGAGTTTPAEVEKSQEDAVTAIALESEEIETAQHKTERRRRRSSGTGLTTTRAKSATFDREKVSEWTAALQGQETPKSDEKGTAPRKTERRRRRASTSAVETTTNSTTFDKKREDALTSAAQKQKKPSAAHEQKTPSSEEKRKSSPRRRRASTSVVTTTATTFDKEREDLLIAAAQEQRSPTSEEKGTGPRKTERRRRRASASAVETRTSSTFDKEREDELTAAFQEQDTASSKEKGTHRKLERRKSRRSSAGGAGTPTSPTSFDEGQEYKGSATGRKSAKQDTSTSPLPVSPEDAAKKKKTKPADSSPDEESLFQPFVHRTHRHEAAAKKISIRQRRSASVSRSFSLTRTNSFSTVKSNNEDASVASTTVSTTSGRAPRRSASFSIAYSMNGTSLVRRNSSNSLATAGSSTAQDAEERIQSAQDKIQVMFLEQRRKEREARLEVAKERIRQKEETESPPNEKRKVDLVYNWYLRMGMPSQADFKVAIQIMKEESGGVFEIAPDDVDLLPWLRGGRFLSSKGLSNIQASS